MDTRPYYIVYAGYYGHLGEGQEAEVWQADQWTYSRWKPCGHDLAAALALLAQMQQAECHFCGILVDFAT